jgi:hypothetical protein
MMSLHVRFYAKKRIMWVIGETQKPVEKEESVQEMPYRMRSVRKHKQEID